MFVELLFNIDLPTSFEETPGKRNVFLQKKARLEISVQRGRFKDNLNEKDFYF